MERSTIERIAVLDEVIADLKRFGHYQAVILVKSSRTRLTARWAEEEKQHRHEMLWGEIA